MQARCARRRQLQAPSCVVACRQDKAEHHDPKNHTATGAAGHPRQQLGVIGSCRKASANKAPNMHHRACLYNTY